MASGEKGADGLACLGKLGCHPGGRSTHCFSFGPSTQDRAQEPLFSTQYRAQGPLFANAGLCDLLAQSQSKIPAASQAAKQMMSILLPYSLLVEGERGLQISQPSLPDLLPRGSHWEALRFPRS